MHENNEPHRTEVPPETYRIALPGPPDAGADGWIRILLAAVALLALAGFGLSLGAGAESTSETEEEEMLGWATARQAERQSLRQSFERRRAETGSAYLEAASELYEERGYQALWVDHQRIHPRAEMVTGVLGRCRLATFPEGLEPRRLARALELMRRYPAQPEVRDELELRLTEAFVYCAEHLRRSAEAAGWDMDRPPAPEPIDALRLAAEPELTPAEVNEALVGMNPTHPLAARLEQAVERYGRIVDLGGWPRLGDVPKLHLGDTMAPDAWETLVERLQKEGYLGETVGERNRYGSEIEAAIRRFQGSHGLDEDGKLGSDTLAALEVPAGDRLAQLELNLMRSHWLPVPVSGREVLVNLPSFRLWVLEGGEPIESMKVIVGKPSWPTPVLTDTIEYLVVNPAWNVPSTIARHEILPRLRKEPEKLIAEGFEVVTGLGDEARYYDLANLDAETLAASDAEWRFRQRPGAFNPLGKIKFIFPNQHSVYLHDTSAPRAFARAHRALSHGCVRVEQPRRLVQALLGTAEAQQVLAALDSGVRDTSYLSRPTPVAIVYLTAWVDADGTVGFYEDVYDRDRSLLQTLTAQPQAGSANPATQIAQLTGEGSSRAHAGAAITARSSAL